MENIFLPFLFIFLQFLSFIIPMAFLFSTFLVFNKLNTDNEYVAIISSGYSLIQLLKPVLTITVVLYIISILVSFFIEPWARRELLEFYNRKAKTEIENLINNKLQSGVFIEDFVGFSLYAQHVSDDKNHLDNIIIVPYESDNFFILFAPTASFLGSISKNNLKFFIDYGLTYFSNIQQQESTIIKIKKMELDLMLLLKNKFYTKNIDLSSDYLAMYPYDLYKYLKKIKSAYKNLSLKEQKKYRNASFYFYQKLFAPFIILAFGILGVVFGIYDPRTAKNFGYIFVLGTIMITYLVQMLFRGWAENGLLPAFWAVIIPISVFLILAIIFVIQKNKIPPSELAFNPRYIPLLEKLFKRNNLNY